MAKHYYMLKGLKILTNISIGDVLSSSDPENYYQHLAFGQYEFNPISYLPKLYMTTYFTYHMFKVLKLILYCSLEMQD